MRYVVGIEETDRTQVATAGGKGANLGELARIDGILVPDGFCVTTDAFARIVAEAPSIQDHLARLADLRPADRTAIRTLSAEIRQVLDAVPIPDDLAAAIGAGLARLGEHGTYAVRSSATAEDLPSASFAGQQDSYLNVVGLPAVLDRVRQCWASLFSERAVAYRLRNGFDQHSVHMAVVVQRMIASDASGVLFTADPLTSNRKVLAVEAGWGLGEALVAGLLNPDSYKVRDGEVVERTVATDRPALSDAQAIRLAQLGRRIEAHFGHPQDIEWCRSGEDVHIVQSRPITTLFPLPVAGDGENDGEDRVYVSVGHQQMMTDPMKPLGLSLWQLTTPRAMYEAGGRLFVDVAPMLASPASRANIMAMLGRSDPLIGDALQTVVDRGDFIGSLPDGAAVGAAGDSTAGAAPDPIQTDPAIVTELIEHSAASVATLRREIRTLSGPALFDFILADIAELKRILFDPRSHQVIMAGMEANWWLSDHLHEWLGEQNAADPLTRSVPHNVTSEMGLALLEVADVIRPHPAPVAFLQGIEDAGREDDGFLAELATVAGGAHARDAIRAFLDKYGMRCTGEIDITRPRWSERPTTLVPTILGNVRNFDAGAGERRFEQGRQVARKTEEQLLARLRQLPDGQRKAAEAKRMIDRVRTFAGYREYPKYGMVSRYFAYKQALLGEAERLVRSGLLSDAGDIYYLRFEELHEVVRTNHVDEQLIRRRKEEFRSYRALTPPRVHTSDGAVVTGTYRRDDLPPGALAGLPVSAGMVEGRARVIMDLEQADLEAGDILVTAYTDPSWTPLFLAIEALVTEVGGLMTHGAVIAREYGLPAVVGVQRATELIRDGQRIRVHGTEGYVEILTDP